MLRRGSIIVLGAVLALLMVAPSAGAFIYFTNPSTNSIGRASIDGSGVDPNFIPTGISPCGVAIDDQYVYFSNLNFGGPGNATVGRATLEGGSVNPNLITGGTGTCGVATPGNGVLFWTNMDADSIGTGNNDGTGVNQSLIGPSVANKPFSIAALGSQLFWLNAGDDKIYDSPTSGQDPSRLIESPFVNGAGGIAVTSSKVYWALDPMTASGRILSIDPGGGTPSDVVTNIPDLCGVATDGTYLYWGGDGVIGRALLNGTDVDMDFATLGTGPGAPDPCSLAVDADTADASIDPSSLDLGSVLVDAGPSAPQSVTLSNSSSTSVDLVPQAPGLTGADADQFTVSGDTCGATVAPGASCTISVQFSPNSLGGKQATLTIPTNDPADQTIEVPLSGKGTDPDEEVAPGAIAFGSALVGAQTDPQAITLTNGASASAPDSVGQASLAGPDSSEFTIDSDGCSDTSLAIGASCRITVSFSPDAVGGAEASLTIPSDDPTSPATVALSGTGVTPAERVLPTSLSFGNQTVDTHSATQAVTVANTADGTGPLRVGAAAVGGSGASQFELVFDDCSGQSVSPGDDCQLGVRFAPTEPASHSATLEIPSNGSSSPVAVSLSGTGIAAVAPAPQPPPSHPNCKKLRAKLKKAKTKKKRKAIRKQLRKRGC